ncbi:SAM-dependent methyltransferase [Actinoplanes sp. KI2]|uniref:SAM-dependent methyltransferase n=1 Tax=Actinoplanes sp. KI2 TaxID=2983315 RepID=UPI0021D5B30C|nr:SAM-dependent methyltransferase [Actinoplanes sp. KI2]MCU7726979.1 SAM-dependent methyltransferase [Actinoplanes sp. KI2]
MAPQTMPEVDPQRPTGARVYDYYLGGTHNFAADRQAAAVALAAMPHLPDVVRMGRAFLRRAVTEAASAGLDQFFDLGAGIPAPGSVAEVARAVRPGCRIVSVDVDPVAVVHTRRLAAGDPGLVAVLADLTDADEVLTAPGVPEMIDFDRPVCVLALAVAQFITDTERLARALERYREVLAPGSWLVMSHACTEEDAPHAQQLLRIYSHTTSPLMMRSRDEFRALFGDWDLVPPGLIAAADWRPAEDDPRTPRPARRETIAGAAVKPAPG